MKHPDFARVKLEKMSSDHEEKGTPSRTLSLAMNSIQFRLTAESVLSTVRSETDPQHHINIFSKGILAEALRRLDGTQRRMWRIAALSQSQKKVDQQLEFLKKKVVEECIRDRNAATIERVVKFGTELETIERVGKMFNTDSQLFTNPLAEYQFLFNS